MPFTSGLIEVALTEEAPTLQGASPVDVALAETAGMDGASPVDVSLVEVDSAEGSSPVDAALVETLGAFGASPVDVALVEGGNTEGASPVDVATTEAIVGNITGRPADGSERPAPGGLGLQVDGGPEVGEGEVLDFDTTLYPGMSSTGQPDPPNRRTQLFPRVDAEVELVRTTASLSAPGTTTLYAPTGNVAGVIFTRALVRVTSGAGTPVLDIRHSNGESLLDRAAGFPGVDFGALPSAQVPVVGSVVHLSGPQDDVNTYVDAGNLDSIDLEVLTGAGGGYDVEITLIGRAIPV